MAIAEKISTSSTSSRREFLKTAGIVAVSTTGIAALPFLPDIRPRALAAQASVVSPAKEAYPLTGREDVLIDGKLIRDKHPLLKAVGFALKDGEGLEVSAILRVKGKLWISDQEDSVSSSVNTVCSADAADPNMVVRQVIAGEFNPGQMRRIYVGVTQSGEGCEVPPQLMQVYQVTRNTDGNLSGDFEGQATFDPRDLNLLTMR